MSIIKPFNAYHYNHKKFKNFTRLTCPPYDVIAPDQLRRLKKTHAYNFAHILLTDSRNDYKALGRRFRAWVDKKVLIQDTQPCFYLYEQMFEIEGRPAKRIGILGLLKIDKEGLIHPHEHTFHAPKKDRFSILKELKANLSPIFTLVPGKVGVLSDAYSSYKKKKPFISFTDRSGVGHVVWRINDTPLIRRIMRSFAKRNLFIADGHHRFEVGRRFWKTMKGKFKDLDYILAYFTDSVSGVCILPTHRIVATDTKPSEFFKKITRYFDLMETDKKTFTRTFSTKNSISLGIHFRKKYYLLRLKNPAVLDTICTKDEAIYKNLNVCLLHKLVLPFLKNARISYTHSLPDAIRRSTKGQWGLVLKPTSLKEVFTIAGQGARLPQKTTYFYPKLLSGLLVRKFER